MNHHEEMAQAAAYALGALDHPEWVAFEAHLATCSQCQAEVKSFRETAAQLAATVESGATPLPAPDLRNRVLAASKSFRRIYPPTRLQYFAPRLALAASIVLALVLGAAWWRERGERRELATRVAEQNELLSSLLAPDVGVANLAASGRPPSARLFWDAKRQRVVVAVYNLPPAAAGRTYQLWAIAKGQAPVSVGTFNTGADGSVRTVLTAPAGVAFDLTAVTEEPAGGSPQPTQNPFLVGPLGLLRSE